MMHHSASSRACLVLFIALIGGGLLAACDEQSIDQFLQDDLTEEEVAAGLKSALKVGTDTSVQILNQKNGYFKDQDVKILWPPEALKVKNTLESSGFGFLVDDVVLKMNRAAEDAASKAKPIFKDAITSMTIQDAFSILNGTDTAATNFLRVNTRQSLKSAFKPDIEESLNEVGATSVWEEAFTTYNAIPGMEPVNADLPDYATNRALEGLFQKVKKEEEDIRKDPAARVNDLLKKVFGAEEEN